MNLTFTQRSGNSRLLLIMAGWGMDANPFKKIAPQGYDVAVGWDYTDETIDRGFLEGYREIVLVAWSMGVFEAGRILPGLHLPLTLTVAVNGTEMPVHDTEGIPVAVFNGTLEGLNEVTLARFNRRMCGGGEGLKKFNDVLPGRSVESLRDELAAIGGRAVEDEECRGAIAWDRAVVGERDMIFPVENQRRAWEKVHTLTLEAPHLPDWDEIIGRLVVNKSRVADRFDTTRAQYDERVDVQLRVAQEVGKEVVDMIQKLPSGFRIVEIGAGSGLLTSQYAHLADGHSLELWDIAPVNLKGDEDGAVVVTDDAEARLMELEDSSVDMVVSSSTLQWFNSPVNALRQIQRILSPGGRAVISLYIEGTFGSMAAMTGTTLNYATRDELEKAVKGDTRLVSSKVECYREYFDSTRDLLEHVRATGVNGVSRRVGASTLRHVLGENKLRELEYNALTMIIEKI